MKENGKMIKEMDWDFKGLPMNLFIMATTKIINLKEKENSQIVWDKFMRVNGKTVSNKVRDFGKGFMVKHLWDNGKMESHMDTVCL